MLAKSIAFAIILLSVCVAAEPEIETEDVPKTFQQLYPKAAKRVEFDLLGHFETVDNAKSYLIKSITADDATAIKDALTKLTKARSELQEFRRTPFHSFMPWNANEGDVGHLQGFTVKRESILSANDGIALCEIHGGGFPRYVKITGLTKEQMSGERYFTLEKWQAFSMCGATTVNAVTFLDEKLIEIKCPEIKIVPKFETYFTEEQKKQILAALDGTNDTKLTDEQQTQADKSRQNNAKMQASKEASTNLKTSKAYLETAKTLLSKSKNDAAKKLLEKSIAVSPNSQSAKEAKKLLDGIK